MKADDELVSIIRSHRRNSLGSYNGDLATERAQAMDHYHGRAYGDEQLGRSQVVSRDLSEAVDWAMPAIIRTFLQSGQMVAFIPEREEDEEAAQQASDYVNHVILKDNQGFIVLHDCIKDSLVLKNGYVKHYWDETNTVTMEEYEGLTDMELASLMMDLEQDGSEVVIKGHDQSEPDEMGQSTHDVQLQITRKRGKVVIEAIPPEEIRVSRKCRGNLQESPFTEHVTTKTRSELVEMGMPADFVATLAAFSDDDTSDQQELSRDTVTDESDDLSETTAIGDRAMDEIQYCEAYIRVDADEDGIAELRKIVTVADRIPPGEDWNEVVDCVAITAWQPKRVPHRHVGESLDDELSDLQRIKTTLLRQMLDNIYHTNNVEKVVNERVNLDDFLTSQPGGIKRVMDDQPVEGAFASINVPPILDKILPAIDYIDSVKENRSGISRSMTNMDPDVLKSTTKGAFMESLNQASQRLEMITRMLAETGARELALRVYELVMKHQDKARMIRLRGRYVEVNPRDWKNRDMVTVQVGLGTGAGEERRQKLMMLASLQEKAAQLGLVGPEEGFKMFQDIASTLGVESPEQYVMDPSTPEFQQRMSQQQSQPNPLAEVEQIKGQFRLQSDHMKEQMDSHVQAMQMQMDAEKNAMEMRYKAELDVLRHQIAMQEGAADRASKEAIAAAKLEVQAMIAGLNIDLGEPGIGAGLQDGE